MGKLQLPVLGGDKSDGYGGGSGSASGQGTKQKNTGPCLRTLLAELQLAHVFVNRQSGGGGKTTSEASTAILDNLAETQVAVLEEDKDFVPAMLALAVMFVLQPSQVSKLVS